MVQSNATDVDSYLAEVPEDRRGVLTRLRELCRAELTGFDEVMAYGMPAYVRGGGAAAIAFASQKQYISFYLMRCDRRHAVGRRPGRPADGGWCVRGRVRLRGAPAAVVVRRARARPARPSGGGPVALPVRPARTAPAPRPPLRRPRHGPAAGREGGRVLGEEGGVVGGRALRGGEGLVGGGGAGDDAHVGGAGGSPFAQGRLYGRQVALRRGVLGGQRRIGGEQFGQFAGGPVQDGHREGAGQGLAVGAQFRAQARE